MTNTIKIVIVVMCAVVIGFAVYGIHNAIYGGIPKTDSEVQVKETIAEIRQLTITTEEAIATVREEVKNNVVVIKTTVQQTVDSYTPNAVANEFNSMLAEYRASE